MRSRASARDRGASLARTVRPEEAEYFPRLDMKRGGTQRFDLTEALAETIHGEAGHG